MTDEPKEQLRQRLVEVLEKTLKAPSPAESVSSEDMEALLAVRRRHAGEPLGLEPVTVELVEAMLVRFFRSWGPSPEPWRLVARDIARSLFDHPELRERLRALWTRLAEVSA